MQNNVIGTWHVTKAKSRIYESDSCTSRVILFLVDIGLLLFVLCILRKFKEI